MNTKCNDHQEGIQPGWWLIPITVALRKENPEFKARLGYVVRSYLKTGRNTVDIGFIISVQPPSFHPKGAPPASSRYIRVTTGAHCSPLLSRTPLPAKSFFIPKVIWLRVRGKRQWQGLYCAGLATIHHPDDRNSPPTNKVMTSVPNPFFQP